MVLETEFTPNPLFYMEVPNQDSLLLFGKWWIGENASTLGTIGTSIPKACTAAHKDSLLAPATVAFVVASQLTSVQERNHFRPSDRNTGRRIQSWKD